MKDILKYVTTIMLLAGSFGITKAAEEELTIVNRTGIPIYIALVTTENLSSDKKIYKKAGQVFAKVLGKLDAPLALKPGQYAVIPNLPRAPTTVGITDYNRSLFVTSTPQGLHSALTQASGLVPGNSSRPADALRVGSNEFASIELKNGKFVSSNDSNAVERAGSANKPPISAGLFTSLRPASGAQKKDEITFFNYTIEPLYIAYVTTDANNIKKIQSTGKANIKMLGNPGSPIELNPNHYVDIPDFSDGGYKKVAWFSSEGSLLRKALSSGEISDPMVFAIDMTKIASGVGPRGVYIQKIGDSYKPALANDAEKAKSAGVMKKTTDLLREHTYRRMA